jgi:hypothetical protein
MDAIKDTYRPFVDIFNIIADLIPGMGKMSKNGNILANIFKVMTYQFKLIGETLKWVVEFIIKFWDNIKTAFNWISRFIPTLFILRKTIGVLTKTIGVLTKAIGWIIEHFEEMPIILDAAFGAFKDFTGQLVTLMTNTGDSIFNILKESLNIGAIIKGDTSGIKSATQDAVLQLQKDLGAVDLKKSFQLRLIKGLKQKEMIDRIRAGIATGPSSSSADASGGVGTTELSNVSEEVTGTKATNINLNIEKLIENLNFNTSNLSETTGKIKEEVTRVLIEALRDTTAIATN